MASITSSSPAQTIHTVASVSAQIAQLDENITEAVASSPTEMLAKKHQYLTANSDTVNKLNLLINPNRARRGSTSGIQDANDQNLAQLRERLSRVSSRLDYVRKNIECSEKTIKLIQEVDALFKHELLLDTRELDTENGETIDQYIQTTVALGQAHPLTGKQKLQLRTIQKQLEILSQDAETRFSQDNVAALNIAKDTVSGLLTIPVPSTESKTVPATSTPSQPKPVATKTSVQQPTKPTSVVSAPAAQSSAPEATDPVVPNYVVPTPVEQATREFAGLARRIKEALRLPGDTLVRDGGLSIHWHANLARFNSLSARVQDGIPGATQAQRDQFKQQLSISDTMIKTLMAKINTELRKKELEHQVSMKRIQPTFSEQLTALEKDIEEAMKLAPEAFGVTLIQKFPWRAATAAHLRNQIQATRQAIKAPREGGSRDIIPGATLVDLVRFEDRLSRAQEGIDSIEAKIKEKIEKERAAKAAIEEKNRPIKESIANLRTEIPRMLQQLPPDDQQGWIDLIRGQITELRAQSDALGDQTLIDQNNTAFWEVEQLLPRQQLFGAGFNPLSQEEALADINGRQRPGVDQEEAAFERALKRSKQTPEGKRAIAEVEEANAAVVQRAIEESRRSAGLDDEELDPELQAVLEMSRRNQGPETKTPE